MCVEPNTAHHCRFFQKCGRHDWSADALIFCRPYPFTLIHDCDVGYRIGSLSKSCLLRSSCCSSQTEMPLLQAESVAGPKVGPGGSAVVFAVLAVCAEQAGGQGQHPSSATHQVHAAASSSQALAHQPVKHSASPSQASFSCNSSFWFCSCYSCCNCSSCGSVHWTLF